MNSYLQGVPILQDSFGRVINNLRISVTDRCNFRCRYCMPEEGMNWLDKNELLTYEEMARVTRIFARLGVTKVRLTGGEPLMRRDLHVLVGFISRIEGIRDLSLTTNGFFLSEQAELLSQAGLRRINVSLDSLDPVKFNLMTRRNYYHRVWEGIETAEKVGLTPIKLNAVLMRGINDNEIPKFASLVREKEYIVRFIEFMPIGQDDGWTIDRVVPTGEVIERIEASMGKKLVAVEYHGVQPADRYRFEDGRGEIGFISSVSDPFCNHCNRVRVTSDGKLRTCLFSLEETDLRTFLRGEASNREIEDAIVKAVLKKEKGHLINQPGFVRPNRTMSQIGG
ncbi:MAG: GTP 3',8-cyclase MoaA [Ignavibacteriales bacterium]|nr:GTP 3',8-cyclase MoaA [Ignavibacteriales bacterium]